MDLHYKQYTNRLSDKLFQLQNILHCLDAIIVTCAPNLNVLRINAAKLSIHLLLVTILSTKQFSITTFSVFNSRKPTLNLISINLIRELFPLYRTDRSYELTFVDDYVLSQLISLRDKVEAKLPFSSSVVNDAPSVLKYQTDLLVVLNKLISLYPNKEMFVQECVDILLEINKYLEVGTRTWEQASVLFQGSDPDSVKLCYRRIFSLDDGMFASTGSDFPHIRCFYLYSFVAVNTSVSVAGKSFICSSPSGEDKVTVIFTPIKSMFIDLYNSFKYESRPVKDEVAPSIRERARFSPKPPAERETTGKRAYSSGVRYDSHIYRFIDGSFVYETSDKVYFEKFRLSYKRPKDST